LQTWRCKTLLIMKKALSLLIATLLLNSCHSNQSGDLEQWKQEITDTELAFSAMAEKEGIPAAFLAYSANDGVIMRNNKVIKGHPEMEKYFQASGQNPNRLTLTWAPDFVDVAASGDMAYTYGQYKLTITDTTGNTQEANGIFHTVWRRQADGSWKFVWD